MNKATKKKENSTRLSFRPNLIPKQKGVRPNTSILNKPDTRTMEEISDTLFSLLVAGKMTTSEAFPFLLVQPPGQPVVLSISVFKMLGLGGLCGLGV